MLKTTYTGTMPSTRAKKSGPKIRVGTRGRIIDVDGNRSAAFYEDGGARARVVQRLYFPDAVIVELLNDGPWGKRGLTGQVELRYFVPDAK